MSGVELGIVAAAIGGILVIVALNRTLERNEWRQCSNCQRYFDARGRITKMAPLLINIEPGVCGECCQVLEGKL